MLRHLNLTTVIPDLDVFHANVVEGAANVSFSEFFSTALKNTHVIRLRGRQDYFKLYTLRQVTPTHPHFFLTGIAADVEGWGSAGGGPGEAGRMVLRVGLTVFLIHVATVEL